MGFPNVRVFNGTLDAHITTERFSGQYEKAQKWLDNQVLTDSNVYTPFLSGNLRKSGIAGTHLGDGEVIWNSPYARYQYYGKVMVGPPPKQVTDKPLEYHHPGTGAFWFEEAKSVNKPAWIAGARKLCGGG